jgi:DNA-binding protein HU-beta
MTKQDLVDIMSNEVGFSKKDATRAVDAVLDAVTKALRRGEKVQLAGFGTFEVRSRNAREGRNPQTGQTITIPARRAPAFKAGKALKEAVQ